MSDRKARRRINSFNFQSEGAHVALVDKAANEQEVLVMKSQSAPESEIRKALGKDVTLNLSIMDFLCRYLNLWYEEAEIVAGMLGYTAQDLYNSDHEVRDFIDVVQEQMDSVVLNKSEAANHFVEKYEQFAKKYDIKTPTENLEDNDQMTTQTNDAANAPAAPTQSQEDIEKAAARDAELTELRKAHEQQAEELRILKAAEERRENEVYMAKAASHMPNIPESEGVQQADLSVALRKMEADPEMAPLATLISSYADVIAKSEKLDEAGTTATDDQSGFDNQVARIAKSLKEADPSLTDRQAEMRAFEQAVANS